jgi:predicted transcriptional regulator
MNNEVVDPHLTTKIVTSYVRHHTVVPDQVSELITSVHRTLGQLGHRVQPEEVRTPAVSVRQSVRHEYVVCLDCGYRGKMLQRHVVGKHGLNRDEYLQRWGLRSDHPLTAPAYSERRSIMAKELGLGRKPSVAVNEAATPAVAAASVNADGKSEATPARRRGSRSKPADVVNEAAAAPPPARRGRPRSRAPSPPGK